VITGHLPAAKNNVEWSETILAINADDNQPFDLTGAEIEMAVSPPGRRPALTIGTATGEITLPQTGIITWRVPAGTMGRLCSGTYEVDIIGKRDGVPFDIGLLSVPVLQGRASL
jgi:hypothetical protein